MRNLDKIIIHHSDSDIPTHDNISVIREWHLMRGFSDVGYHYFIKSNGVVQNGRDLDRQGAHCAGQNKNSIGICLHGTDSFSGAQFIVLTALIKSLKLIFGDMTIHAHNEFSIKSCPNFDVTKFKTL